MLKNKIFSFIIISIILYTKCDEQDDLKYDNDYNEAAKHFKESLKQYLIDNKLFNSEKIIERDEMKKILLDILTEKDVEFIPEFLQEILEILTKHFIDKYYKERKIIRGKDLFDLIDIEAISEKFQELTDDDYDVEETEKEEKENNIKENNDNNKSTEL